MYLLGASGHAKVIIDILRINKIELNGFFDDNPILKEFQGLSTQGLIEDSDKIAGEYIISIGSNTIRRKIAEKLNHNYISAIHPNSIIDKSVKIESGTVIMAGAILNADSVVGQHVIINTGSVVDHDCVIGNFSHISPNSVLCGNVEIGEGTHFGAGAIAIPGVKIGKWCTIGAGSVVLKDIPDYSTVVGNPGRIIKSNHG